MKRATGSGFAQGARGTWAGVAALLLAASSAGSLHAQAIPPSPPGPADTDDDEPSKPEPPLPSEPGPLPVPEPPAPAPPPPMAEPAPSRLPVQQAREPVVAPLAIARHELTLSATGSANTSRFAFAGGQSITYANGTELVGGVSYTLYLRPLVEDGMPYSMQSFLQRAPFLGVTATGGGSSTTYVPGVTSSDLAGSQSPLASGAVAGSFFPRHWFRVGLSAGASWSEAFGTTRQGAASPSSPISVVSGSLDLAVRGDRWEVALTYANRAGLGMSVIRPIDWGTFTLTARGLSMGRHYLVGWIAASSYASGVGGSYERFVGRSLGIYGDASYNFGTPYVNSPSWIGYTIVRVGAAWWVVPRARLEASLGLRETLGGQMVTSGGSTYETQTLEVLGTVYLTFRFR